MRRRDRCGFRNRVCRRGPIALSAFGSCSIGVIEVSYLYGFGVAKRLSGAGNS